MIKPAKFFLSGLLLVALAPREAGAASRTVYFNASGVNRTTKGLATTSTVNSTCRLVISNPSGKAQSFAITSNVSSIDPPSASTTNASLASSPSTSGAATVSACTVSACSGSLPGTAGGSSVSITYTYTAYPSITSVTAGKQVLRCSGSIKITDTAPASPGYVLASGTLVTFSESSQMHTANTTSSSSAFGGMPVYSQIPIAINRSKPF